MADVTLISEKGSALSCEELDNNFRAIRELQDNAPDELATRIVGDGSGAIQILDITDADFSGVAVSKPIAYLQMSGHIKKIFDDGYGEPAYDGYGNLESERVDVDVLTAVYVDDDGYGNMNLRGLTIDGFNYDTGDKQLRLALDGDYLGVFNALDVFVLPQIDFESANIALNIQVI